MAKLTRSNANVESKDDVQKKRLKADIESITAEIAKMEETREVLKTTLLELEIKPFKIGDYALAKIPSGRSVKEQKCLLECESGILYLRPVKSDGELSGRHFSLIPTSGHKYSEYLKEVK